MCDTWPEACRGQGLVLSARPVTPQYARSQRQTSICPRTTGFQMDFAACTASLSAQKKRTRSGLDESITTTAQAASSFDSAHLIHSWERTCNIAPSIHGTLAGKP
jgi:hypothetical protein